ncbi:dTDP-glucose 4,6-dehydratase [Labeo rohita]|uniref:dTDP-glucose 4,6-dehydratase n=1 Tax=Labeo rohita TaxID=84645 RepID=A0ABQ8LHF0_LABRO|nr:dTDP-glucose 4,6-dehydratase [Labeo rohita]
MRNILNQGGCKLEAGERVQPSLRQSAVASIIRIFQQTNRMQRLPPSGRRGKLLSNDQELAIVEMVVANNAIKLHEIQTRIVADHEIFDNIDSISLTTITRTLSKHRVRMKQLYTVPLKRSYDDNMSRCQVGPYNTERLLAFLNDLHQRLVPEQDQEGENMRTFVITWDNVAFHHSQAITTWFEVHPRLVSLFLPPSSPFLNPTEEFFSAWRWKVYDHQPHDQMSLLEAMDAGCRDITVDDCQGWIRHTRQFYPRCNALDNIRCDVDENMWPNPEDRRD